MTYTDEEIALIDGVIQSYFAPCSVSQQLREKYWDTHQNITHSRIGREDLTATGKPSGIWYLSWQRRSFCSMKPSIAELAAIAG